MACNPQTTPQGTQSTSSSSSCKKAPTTSHTQQSPAAQETYVSDADEASVSLTTEPNAYPAPQPVNTNTVTMPVKIHVTNQP